MIVRCPSCSARYSLDPKRLGGKRVTLRCQQCREVFKVEVSPPALSAPPEVLVAHSDPVFCATISEVLSAGGVVCRVCHDGPQTLDSMESDPPHVLLIDVALPGLLVFEVVETIRSRPGLGKVKVILMSSVYNHSAYKRSPTSLYGADDYIEKHHVPDLLVEKIRKLLPEETVLPQSGKGEKGRGDDFNLKIRRTEKKEISLPNSSDAVEKARRLARIIVSDIALYHQDRVEEGIRKGTFFQILADEIDEGRRLFCERVAPEVRRREDFLGDAFRTLLENREKDLRQQSEEKVV